MLYQDFSKQYDENCDTVFSSENVAKGLYILSLGLGKKVLIADVLAIFVDEAFSTGYENYNSTMLLIMILAYTMQIYFDFSGYSDMAKGVGLMLNIELPQNFNSPYKAISVNDFWKRWHMSLTGFFTKYLYIPLGESRKGTLITYRNVMIVFLVSGLWHGANYTFIVWGALHGIASVIERKWNFPEKLHHVLRWLYTFVFINFSWLVFRATSMKQVMEVLKGICRCEFTGIDYQVMADLIPTEISYVFQLFRFETLLLILPLVFIVLLMIIVLQFKNSDERISGEFRPSYVTALSVVVIVVWSVLSFGTKITFIYEMF